MVGVSPSKTNAPPLNSFRFLRRTFPNRVFPIFYILALLLLFYHHICNLLSSKSLSSFLVTISLMIADLVLAFQWTATTSCRFYPIHREEYPQNLQKVIGKKEDFPGLDVFICTADPYKEPPIGVVNTALSILAYEYPTEKLSVYVSDDGGSEMTLFAFMEAAGFARYWLPYCRDNKVLERAPDAYFASNHNNTSEYEHIKTMYETMKVRVEHVLERGKVPEEYINSYIEQREVFSKWTDKFTRQDHPAIIQVLLDNSKDTDIGGDPMPNLIYLSREKSKTVPHHFKAGALNALVRVSGVMTNAPIILTVDCDMCSNDPETPLRALCYLADPSMKSQLAYVQFPQRFNGINKNDLYAGDYRRLFLINPMGMKDGPNYVGTGCFFRRRALFGGPSRFISPEVPVLSPDYSVNKQMQSKEILALAHHVARCRYEERTNWGIKVGFRYGSLVEDYYTGYRLQCEGWKSIFCNPSRAAFLGDAPICLIDTLYQIKRWCIGLYEVAISQYSPMTFGVQSMGLLMGLSYAHLAFWALWSIPIIIYAFVPQLALICGVAIFPKVSEPWFLLYLFLFVGAYAQDLVDFMLTGHGSTLHRWWNDQRMWLIRGPTCYLFGTIEYICKSLGISAHGFNVTSKVLDDEQSKKYEQGIFEFGARSPMFISLTLAAIINLVALAHGLMHVFKTTEGLEGLILQVLLAGYGVINCWPIYEAMVLRSDKGKLPTQVCVAAVSIACVLYAIVCLT